MGTRTGRNGRICRLSSEPDRLDQARPTMEGDQVGIQAGIDAMQAASATGH